MEADRDTIAAVATPPGEGGLAVIRISGKGSFSVVQRLFDGRVDLRKASSHTAHYGVIRDKNGDVLDDVVVTLFKKPHSYTGEDTAEIGCHGSPFLAGKILELILDRGARLAAPGEFTKRAFLNGRMDLAQAEAVADLVRSRTEASARSSRDQLTGKLSSQLELIRGRIVEIVSLLELSLDFSEEDVEVVPRVQIADKIGGMIKQVAQLISSFSVGKVYREGVRLAIVGRTNTGKSTLLNALLKEERAIVSGIHGTTRDVIEEDLDIDGVLVRVMDTAGIRFRGPEGARMDQVEAEGVRRAQSAIERADVILWLLDGSQPLREDDIHISERIDPKKTVIVINKADLPQRLDPSDLPGTIKNRVSISAQKGHGLAKLNRAILESALGGAAPRPGGLITNLRHRKVLEGTRKQLGSALKALEKGIPGELVVLDLRAALDIMGEITGETATEEILNQIFSRFCIGK